MYTAFSFRLLLRAFVSWTVLCYVVVVRMGTTKIFVGNIRDGTTSESLRELFECYGRVTEADVLSGFGFVVSMIVLFSCRCPHSTGVPVCPPKSWKMGSKVFQPSPEKVLILGRAGPEKSVWPVCQLWYDTVSLSKCTAAISIVARGPKWDKNRSWLWNLKSWKSGDFCSDIWVGTLNTHPSL